jgi:hypothetical protein
MSNVRFLVHPVAQLGATALAAYVFLLGLQRFRSLHLGSPATFKWKRHVFWGKVALIAWAAGLFGGLYMVKTSWYGFLITGLHGRVGIAMLPFILFGLLSGLLMDYKKQKRKVLPLLHALSNALALVLALSQAITGIMVYNSFVLGN